MDRRLSRIFTFQSWLVMVGWIVLIAFPFWSAGTMVVWSIIVVLCGLYAYLLLLGGRYDEGHRPPSYKGFLSLKGVMKLFENPRVTLTGWTHFLAFDLLVGLLIVADSQDQDLSHWIIAPLLFVTLWAGPFGFLLYVAFRFFYAGGVPDLTFGGAG